MIDDARRTFGPPSVPRAADFDAAAVFRENQPALLRHLLYLTGDRPLAEDLAQEAFGRLVQAAKSEAVRNPRAWLMTVGSNLAYNHFRGEERRAEREAAHAGPVEAVAPDIDAVADVRRCLGKLDARDRAVLMLRHSGFTYAEIAEAVGLAPASIGTVLARAQRRFRDIHEGVAAPQRRDASHRHLKTRE